MNLFVFCTFLLLHNALLDNKQEGHLEVVKFLFEKGAKVDQAYNGGGSPLLIASQVCILFV